MARTINPIDMDELAEIPVDMIPILHRWERIAGKHYSKEHTIVPGEIVTAPAGTYSDEPQRWKDLGPAVVVVKNELPVPSFRKEQTEEGWFLYKGNYEKPFNEIPLTESEVDELINEAMER